MTQDDRKRNQDHTPAEAAPHQNPNQMKPAHNPLTRRNPGLETHNMRPQTVDGTTHPPKRVCGNHQATEKNSRSIECHTPTAAGQPHMSPNPPTPQDPTKPHAQVHTSTQTNKR
ncbi:hypothetical protein BS47DRAFT_1369812 [Hydnum rufescens UP504]|uniref:Uncharacterized protein n=1 Tax=Hydnum rufescens UP504 TaxID=1448309 RepID=A0A9P6ABK8_9AGAM|nr:hypothetical protein BS47DRAFT_1369812 [Hydnum rufescens UP504]